MGKTLKSGKIESGKLHMVIPRANWERIETYLKAYNDNQGRVTPKIKLPHVLNQALLRFLTGRRG
jgi:hypothetical protein